MSRVVGVDTVVVPKQFNLRRALLQVFGTMPPAPVVAAVLLAIAGIAVQRLQGDRDILSFLLTHQAEAFALGAALIGTVAVGVAEFFLRSTITLVELRRKPTLRGVLRWARSGTWVAVIVVALISGAVGYVVGRPEPAPKTLALEFPQPDCERQGGAVLIFLHGWLGDPLETWRRFPALACDDPALRTLTIISLNYPTYVSDRNPSMAQLAFWINKRLIAHGYDRRGQIVIVAHRLGGLVARRMILDRRLELRGKVKQLVEIATPHLNSAP